MKQTAVEQFLNAIKDQINLSQEHLEMIESYASQAKEMEKEQIIKSAQDNFYAGQDLENGYKLDWNSAEDYYKITFKSEKIETKQVERIPCPQCQGGGCPFCQGYGNILKL